MRAGRTMAGVVAGVIGGVVITGTASAATGGSFILGRSNSASATTSLTSGSGPALSLRPGAGAAPLAVASGTKVSNLNVDRLDGLDGTQLQRRVTGSCPQGEAVRGIGATGSVTCDMGHGLLYVTASGSQGVAQALCPVGTAATAGGGAADPAGDGVLAVSVGLYDEDREQDSWVVLAKSLSTGAVGGAVFAEAYCWTGPIGSLQSSSRASGAGSSLRAGAASAKGPGAVDVRQYLGRLDRVATGR